MPDSYAFSEIKLQQPTCTLSPPANSYECDLLVEDDCCPGKKRARDSSSSPILNQHHSDTCDAQSTISQESDSNKKPGRRLMEDDMFDEDEDPKVKRKVQNRAAQRAFRERKERYVKELEKKIKHIQDSHLFTTSQLAQENNHLRTVIFHLQAENSALKGLSSDEQWLPFPPTSQQQHPSLPMTPTYSLDFQSSASGNCGKPVAVLPLYNNSNNNNQPRVLAAGPSPSPSPPPSAPLTVEHPHQFTFAISTPATLRQTQQNEKPGKDDTIELVPLYPDHRHPASHQQQQQQQSKVAQNKSSASTLLPKPPAEKHGDNYQIMENYDALNLLLSQSMMFPE